MLISIRIH